MAAQIHAEYQTWSASSLDGAGGYIFHLYISRIYDGRLDKIPLNSMNSLQNKNKKKVAKEFKILAKQKNKVRMGLSTSYTNI